MARVYTAHERHAFPHTQPPYDFVLTRLEELSTITLSTGALSAFPLPFSEIKCPALIAIRLGVCEDLEREDVMPGPTVNDEDEVGMASPGMTRVVMVGTCVLWGMGIAGECSVADDASGMAKIYGDV